MVILIIIIKFSCVYKIKYIQGMKRDKNYDLIVVGAGPAGMTAGMYGARSGLKALVVEKGISGGLSNEAPEIENYPGFMRVGGMELAEKVKEQVSEYVEIKELEKVKTIETSGKENGENMLVVTEKGSYVTKTAIISTGTKHRKLGAIGEDEFLGRGISYCATCDGFFFRDKPVIVVGGGDSAVREALYLKHIGCAVTLIHRREKLRAEPYLQNKLEEAGVPVLWNSVVNEIKGDKAVRSVVKYDKKKEIEDELPVEGVFISIGEEPVNDLAAQIGIKCDKNGYIIADKHQRTNIERVYAAGDITGGVRQVVVACAEGAIAATSAYNDLLELE
uniref:Dihydrolipoyl dehydrogenase n=1 Tax=Candidatus Methanophagaceae archaeon ANME-1 ERB6 TaxID=2759912 RepID=A0A7G9YT79_9EURY|nr:dihydrolipoyl dehydrogenase [Methanosarcinales archaeon ANME-1 ERB6]